MRGLGACGPHRVRRRLGLLDALAVVEDHRLGAALGRADGDGRAEAGRRRPSPGSPCRRNQPSRLLLFRLVSCAPSCACASVARRPPESARGRRPARLCDQSSIHSAAAASSPGRRRRARQRASGTRRSRCGCAGRAGIGVDADQLAACPPSRRSPPCSSRRQASSTVSPMSTKPPGSAWLALERRCSAADQQHAAPAVERRRNRRRAAAFWASACAVQIPSAAFTCLRPSWCWLYMRPPIMPPSTTMSMPLTKVDAVGGEPHRALGDVVGDAGARDRLHLGEARLHLLGDCVGLGRRPCRAPWP